MPDADIIVSVYNVAGDLIGEQNEALTGEQEQLTNLWLPSPSDYWVEVRTANYVPSRYLLMLLKPDSYAFRHQGMMTIGDTVTGNLAAQTDHFWFFAGNAGETVTITGVPGNGGDLFLKLYDANGENALGFVDEGIAGNSEIISDYILPTTGVYGIRVGEYDFRGGQLSVDDNSWCTVDDPLVGGLFAPTQLGEYHLTNGKSHCVVM